MSLVGPDGKPLSEGNKVPADFRFIGIPVAITKQQTIVSTENKPQVIATFLFLVPVNKLELYSQNEKVMMDVIVTNALSVYLDKVKGIKINDLSESGLQKEFRSFTTKYDVLVSPNVFPLDEVIFDNVPEESILEAVKALEAAENFYKKEVEDSGPQNKTD